MNPSRIFLIIISILCVEFTAVAQEEKYARNSLFLELFGNGGLYSINYERMLNKNLHARVGFATFTSTIFMNLETSVTTFPLLLTGTTGKKKSHFEFGGGVMTGRLKYDFESFTIVDLTAFIGYRYQPIGKGFLFRIGLTPFYSLDDKADYPDEGFFLSGGLSLGYHF